MQDNFLNIDRIVDHHFVVNKNNIITIDIAARGAKTFVGTNVSHREYVTQAQKTLEPVFSNGYLGLDGKTRIGISYPIINTQTGRYLGLVVAVVPIVQFFSNYENVYNIKWQFLVAYDKNKDYIATPRTQLLEKSFFAHDVQEFFHNNQIQNNLYHQVFSGSAGYAVYDFGSGERLNTGYPIFLSGKPSYFVFVITPTVTIYSHVDEALFFTKNRDIFTACRSYSYNCSFDCVSYKMEYSSRKRSQRRTIELELSNEEIRDHLTLVEKELEHLYFD